MATVTDFIFFGSKTTVDGDCSHKIKRCLFLGGKAVTNRRKVMTKVVTVYEKQRHHFANKGPYSQSYGFSSSHIQIWESDHKEAWVPQRTDAFESWCWGRLFRVPWRARRSNKLTLKEINLNIHWKDWCWSSTTLITKCEETTHSKRPWCWDRLRARGEGGDRGWDG